MAESVNNQSSCPLPSDGGERITLNYGEGGRLTRRLIRERILQRFDNDSLHSLPDAAHLAIPPTGRLAFTTDGYVVTPLVFPGGNIGRLAICGTVNDLAVSGARPLWISLGMIIEEGLPWSMLDLILDSIRDTARECGVLIVTGDTKVVPKGAADGLFLTTTGIGTVLTPTPSGPDSLAEGDVLIASGPIGKHGISILCAREDFGFRPTPESDCAPLHQPLNALQEAGIPARAVRDATRGGLTSILHEWAEASALGLEIQESQIPVTPDVRAVCELLGLDPWHLANEGTFVAAFPPHLVTPALTLLRSFPQTAKSCVIGEVTPRKFSPVLMSRTSGRKIPLDESAGAPLPRIC